MTYLFVVIGIAVMNALANKKMSIAEILLANSSLIIIAYILERVVLLKHETRKVILYDNIDLIKPECYDELKADLESRTGLFINRIEIGKLDFLRDVANVRIFYFDQDQLKNYEETEV